MSDPHVAAIVGALNAALPADKQAHAPGDLPTPLPANYVEVIVSRRFGGQERHGAPPGVHPRRATARAVSQIEGNAYRLLDITFDTLQGLSIEVNGEPYSLRFETEDPIGPDDGWFSGLLSFTY